MRSLLSIKRKENIVSQITVNDHNGDLNFMGDEYGEQMKKETWNILQIWYDESMIMWYTLKDQ